MKKRIRILPLGYILILVLLVILLAVISVFYRNQSASDKLFYLYKRYEPMSYHGDFSLVTMGDAVKYTNKAIHVNYEMTPSDDFLFLKLMDETGEDYFFKANALYYQSESDLLSLVDESNNDILLIEPIFEIVDYVHLFQEYVYTFIELSSDYERQIWQTFEDYITYSDDQIHIEMSLEDIFRSINQSIAILSKDNNFITEFENTFEIDFFELLVHLDALEKDLYRDFKSDSEIICLISIDKNDIQNIIIQGALSYKNCDAKEWFEWQINTSPLEKILMID